ncbi:MAG TPA: gamma-glutamyl-gamma-aminobutyrate hydrolase family protein [Chroococcales cyanobacterium]
MQAKREPARKPVIGLNLDIKLSDAKRYSIDQTYTKAVVAAGGIPFLIPPVPEADLQQIAEMIDGVILVGGDDYDPSFYGEAVEEKTEIGSADRQKFDLALGRFLLNQTDLPVLGVCAGNQLINILQGGTLVQDVPTHVPDSTVNHASVDGEFGRHPVSLEDNSRLRAIYGAREVNCPTWHHQSVKKLGHALRVGAIADDGIVEAVELTGDRFVVGVQWHPEQDIATHLPLFREIVEQARKHANFKQAPGSQAGRFAALSGAQSG